MPITAAGIGLALSAGSNLLSAGKSKKEARKQRKLGEAKSAAGLEAAQGSLAFAKELFNNFQPVITDTTNFFSSVPLEDITSGRVLAPEARGALNRFNIGAADAKRQNQENLARRGISNDAAGVTSLNQAELARRETATDIAQSGVSNAIERRIGLTRAGTAQGQSVVNQGNRVSNVLLNQADQAFGRARQARAGASAAAGAAGNSLADIAFAIDNRKRKNPTSINDRPNVERRRATRL